MESTIEIDPIQPSAQITVRDALALPELRRGMPEVVAAADHLDRPIRWVHAGEASNMAALLKGGELLLTTGLGIGPSAADQRRFICELADIGVAGVVLELGTRFAAAPPAMTDTAGARSLPLIQLHREVPFVAVTEAVHTAIVNGHYQLLRRGEDAYQRFAHAMLRGGGVPEVLRLLAESVGNPVFLANGSGRLLASARSSTGSGDPLALWRGVPQRDPAGAHPPDYGAGTALSVPVPPDSDDLSPAASVSRLVVLPTQRALTALDEITVQRASALVALAMLRSRMEEELLWGSHGDFLVDLAACRIPPMDANRRALTLGFAHRDAVLPLVARLPSPPDADVQPIDGPRVGSTALWRRTGRAIRKGLADVGLTALVGLCPEDGRVLVLLGAAQSAQRTEMADQAAVAIQSALREADWAEAAVVVGAVVSWSSAGVELRCTSEAAACADPASGQRWQDRRLLEVDLLLWLLRGHPSLREFVHAQLDPLRGAARDTLLQTLEALCRNLGRKAETSRELGVNRQTLYGRIERLEQLLGVDLDNPDTLVSLRLAFLARRHLSPGPI